MSVERRSHLGIRFQNVSQSLRHKFRSSALPSAMDGSLEKKSSRNSPISAIFVHAGAGYHSTTNEHIHLGACNDAARAAMKILKANGSAVDAVEAAIRVLEDKEITNAGYGSNLTLQGIVECDATVVDHFGRSGACGATPKIKNPIHLARMILDTSSQPLSLRRVPPNLLVGEGATDFAYEYGIPIVPHEILVSRNARERFLRWKEDLKRAGSSRNTPTTPSSTGDEEFVDLDYEERVRNKQRRDHTAALLSATWNEGQPDSPTPESPGVDQESEDNMSYRYTQNATEISPVLPVRNSVSPTETSPAKRARHRRSRTSDGPFRAHSLLSQNSLSIVQATVDGNSSKKTRHSEGHDGNSSPGCEDSKLALWPSRRSSPYHGDSIMRSWSSTSRARTVQSRDPTLLAAMGRDEDIVTDTVGAIAIDSLGRIAAGSSSGGIGMKHSGRVGPAALVGIGTAVIPADVSDPEAITVAAVTSGTGEHMATTMASQKCAERLYSCEKKGPAGSSVPAPEDEVMDSFVRNDFMNHPGVLTSHSAGAIGVMAVKKTPGGYYLHFAHNTDSFALASMHSHEKEPKCTMSRITDQGKVVLGARKIRLN